MIFLIDLMPILWAVVVFTAGILRWAYGLILARKQLVPQGDVKLVVNGDEENPLIAQPGTTLLSALASKSMFLPSACGGGGTCIQCECHVNEGGGEALPTELPHFSRKELKLSRIHI